MSLARADGDREAVPLLSPALSTHSTHSLTFPPGAELDSDSSHTADLEPATPVTEYKSALLGFYVYSIASEIWVIAAGTLFLPVVIETYARSNGTLAPEHVTPCPPEGGPSRCAVKILFTWVDTASFSLFVYSASVAVQALTVISIGSVADDPSTRRKLLASFALIGSLSSISFLFLSAHSYVWPLCTVLALVSNVSFGAAGTDAAEFALVPVPSLAQRSQRVTEARSTVLDSLSPSRSKLTSYAVLKSQETARISSRAIAAGYAAGILVLIGMLPVIGSLNQRSRDVDETWPLRVAIAISGACWLFGSIIAFHYLRDSNVRSQERDPVRISQLRQQIRDSWRGLGIMLKNWRKLPNTFTFLSAWFLLSDSFATLTSTAMLFAKTTLNLSTSSLIVVAILTPSAGIIGSLLVPYLQSKSNWMTRSNLRVLVLLVLGSTLVPIWGIVSLESKFELYSLAIGFGMLYGSFQSYSRTCYSELVPIGQAARWFGLYSITDKSSSFLGPLLVSIITNQTGQIRHGFYLILAFFLISLPILIRVDLEQGSKDVERFEKPLELEPEPEQADEYEPR
ncbi:Atg22p [Sporobolomyces koalae]|uniref:Atg22p n=1 Tax=Sporobolomyces koalae TaxID=500713 RepID=UPI00316D73BA